jgi:uncharacterized membrane protein YedE/YeeE
MPDYAATLRNGSAAVRGPSVIAPLTILVAAGLGLCAWLAAGQAGLKGAALVLVGGGLGFALHRSGFGFAGAWRAQVMEARGAGLRTQLALLAMLTVVFFPLFARGEFFGQPLADVVRPVGAALLAGAFLFGIGAQWAGACSSGSLTALGNGRLRYVVVILAMVAGATLGSAHFGWWEARPSWFSFSLAREWGPAGDGAGNLAIIAGLAWLSLWLERRRHGNIRRFAAPPVDPVPDRRFAGRWPIGRGILAIAALCTLTLLLAGRPWTIMTAPPLWGAKVIEATGMPLDVAFWDYWSAGSRADALGASLWADLTTIMIVGLVLGTALAASLGRTLRTRWRIGPGEFAGAALGGLLLGYGGVVGLGCNIGAFLGGVSSGSLHGWFWLLAAFAGTAVGAGARALAGRLAPRRPAGAGAADVARRA